MVIAPENETRLIELAQQGDIDSFGALYSGYLDPIFRYVYYRIGDTPDAEDLTEQVFLKAWEALPNYRQIGSRFVNWLYRIAHNAVIDYHRQRKWVVKENQGANPDRYEPAMDSALETIILAEEASALSAAVRNLPEEYQQVVVLRFIEGLSHTEIAHILDKSEVSCRGIQHRALVSLSKLLMGMRERD